MALTYTPEANLKMKMPAFVLPDVFGKVLDSNQIQGVKGFWVMFICNHCPYVQAIEDRFLSLAKEALSWGISVIAICSNDPEDHPEDSPNALRANAETKKFPFPYLIDASQNVARDFGAVCTPDFFVFDSQRNLISRGRLDDSWRDPQRVTRMEMREVLLALKEGLPIPTDLAPAMGCSIKWKSEPTR